MSRGDESHEFFDILKHQILHFQDYAVVQSNCFGNYNHFEVATMLNLLDELNIPTNSSVPDHSLLLWDYITKDNLAEGHQFNRLQGGTVNEKQPKSFRGQQGKLTFRTNGDEEKALDKLSNELEDLTHQGTLHIPNTMVQSNYNSFYCLIETVFSNQKTHHRSSKKPWWNAELDSLRKELRQLQSKWNRAKYPSKVVK